MTAFLYQRSSIKRGSPGLLRGAGGRGAARRRGPGARYRRARSINAAKPVSLPKARCVPVLFQLSAETGPRPGAASGTILPEAISAIRRPPLFRRSTPAALTLGVTHAPYRRVLDRFTDLGADMIFAGHTHGGQVCVPGYGALVTNCDLDAARVKATVGEISLALEKVYGRHRAEIRAISGEEVKASIA